MSQLVQVSALAGVQGRQRAPVLLLWTAEREHSAGVVLWALLHFSQHVGRSTQPFCSSGRTAGAVLQAALSADQTGGVLTADAGPVPLAGRSMPLLQPLGAGDS